MTLFNADGTIDHRCLINWNQIYFDFKEFPATINTKFQAIIFLEENIH
jgi:hypothetical protein